MCVDYRDVNQACPKDNYPTPFIDQIIDECARCQIFSFIDGFSGYNQINICPQGIASKPNRDIVAINVFSMEGKPKATLIKRLDR